jgi:hypothetical protein
VSGQPALLRRAWVFLIASAVAGCGAGGASDAVGPPPCCFTLSLPTTALSVVQGSSINLTVTLTRTNDYTPAVMMLVDSIPSGVTAAFNPVSLSGATLRSTLTITATANTSPVLGAPFLIHGLGTDSLRSYTGGSLSVTMPRVNVSLGGTGAGTVTSSPAGIDCGTTCGANFPYGSEVTLTARPDANSAFAGWGGACANGSGTCTVIAQGTTAVTATFNSTTPSFSFSITPATVTLAQGGSAAATLNVARLNGYAGAVNLGVSGAPTGLTVSPNPASVTGTSATLDVAAAPSLGVSNYPITVTATGAGVPQQTAVLHVQVTPGQGGTGDVTMSLGNCDPTGVPIWFGVQNGNGPWTNVPRGANNSFTFTIETTGAFAYVTRDGTDLSTKVTYLTAAEARSIALGSLCAISAQTGTKQLSGTVGGVAATASWTLAIGGASARNDGTGGAAQPFTVTRVPAGARDLVAARLAPVAGAPGVNGVQRTILRRNTTYSDGSAIPVLDFNGPEAITPVAHFILLNNIGSDASSVEESLITTNGATSPFFTSAGGVFPAVNANAARYFPLPESLLRPGDLHQLTIAARNGESFRLALLYLRQPAGDTTVTFGPPLATATVTGLGTTPYPRLRAQLPSQSTYNGATSFELEQSDRRVEVFTTAAYLGGAPANWTLDVPDLSSAGYDASWGLRGGTPVTWTVVAVGGDVLPFIGATPSDAARVIGAGASSSSNGSPR